MAARNTTEVFDLVSTDPVYFSPRDDVTLPCHLSPETNAVAMEIRWFKWRECIYLYRSGHVIEGRGYEGRVSVDPQQLQRGDVSLTLRESRKADWGQYICQVIRGEDKKEGYIELLNRRYGKYIPERSCCMYFFRREGGYRVVS
ncbi:butyrophilin subfamily 1 member A1-like [Sardina pilchardus]|uniref:butyrophilin subfamily 1 member A1-like n=1 Tax=Sardina pilchardus TaxID=27697 RepID=UPI002E0FCAA7